MARKPSKEVTAAKTIRKPIRGCLGGVWLTGRSVAIFRMAARPGLPEIRVMDAITRDSPRGEFSHGPGSYSALPRLSRAHRLSGADRHFPLPHPAIPTNA